MIQRIVRLPTSVSVYIFAVWGCSSDHGLYLPPCPFSPLPILLSHSLVTRLVPIVSCIPPPPIHTYPVQIVVFHIACLLFVFVRTRCEWNWNIIINWISLRYELLRVKWSIGGCCTFHPHPARLACRDHSSHLLSMIRNTTLDLVVDFINNVILDLRRCPRRTFSVKQSNIRITFCLIGVSRMSTCE